MDTKSVADLVDSINRPMYLEFVNYKTIGRGQRIPDQHAHPELAAKIGRPKKVSYNSCSKMSQ
jgi:hypothetical protein